MTSEATVTTAQIKALRTEAAQAGDLAQVAVCDRAIEGDESAVAACTRAIQTGQGWPGLIAWVVRK